MKQSVQYTGYLLLLLLLGFLVWQFWFIVVWVLIAALVSFLGRPVVRWMDRWNLGRFRIPHAVSAMITLLGMLLVFSGLMVLIVPLVIQQAETISKVGAQLLGQDLQPSFYQLQNFLHDFDILPEGQTIQDYILLKARSLVSLQSVTTAINKIFYTLGDVFLGIFSVLFISFFFLKDEHLLEEGVLLLVPEAHHASTRKVVADSKYLLRRYVLGVLLQVSCIISIITLILWVLGVDNALLIGVIGGLMNIIPYLGPLIGCVIGVFVGISATLAAGASPDIVPVVLKIISAFVVANIIDNNLLVPLIYSSSVKAHPLEIFFVIIMAGSVFGIFGMVLAVPVYTVVRVIAREFFQEFRIIKRLTSSFDK